MPSNIINIYLVAPLPPQFDGRNHSCGGIGHWTQMILQYADSRSDVCINVIDTTPGWRSTHNFSLWKRAVGGGLKLSVYMTHLFKVLIRGKVDVIHMTTSGQLGVIRDIAVISVAKLFRVPVNYHIRFGRVPEIAAAKSGEWRMISLAMRMAKTVVAIDKATYEAVTGHLPSANVALIPNCINFSQLNPERVTVPGKKTVLFAGWVIPNKGIAELLEAWSKIGPSEWTLNVVGPVRKEYKQELIDKYGAKGVHFLGEKTHGETISLISACDVFVLPSYTEGFPNAVLEAMALGKPVVASAVGAIPEMLAEGCGQLIAARNVDSLKGALELMIEDAQLRADMGARARRRAFENYSIEAVFARYMDLWRESRLGNERR